MQICFLLGPAGCGKTQRCLAEVRAALLGDPQGAPLIFLAPKQATFQLERQLLSFPDLPGYARLMILSFERLAHYLLEIAHQPANSLLDGPGCLMVLQAILLRLQGQLRVFGASVHRPGFTAELHLLLQELRAARLSVADLRRHSQGAKDQRVLADKLHDLGLILGAYDEWCRRQDLQDGSGLLEQAAAGLRGDPDRMSSSKTGFRIDQVWMDGFAQLTEQELELLAALAPHCQRMTLAFCCETGPGTAAHWLSHEAAVNQTVNRIAARLDGVVGLELAVESLGRDPGRSRFAQRPALAHLEQYWGQGIAFPAPVADSLRIAVCPDPAREARLAAEEILRHVQRGGRYREIAILVRQLEHYQDPIRRELTRYQIPFFLDQRQPAGHHPLAELIRSALGTVAHGWRHAEWFQALKTGLVTAREEDVDRLENLALAQGWQGEDWTRPLAVGEAQGAWAGLEALRQEVVPPFVRLGKALGFARDPTPASFTGSRLAAALRELFEGLEVRSRLQAWSDDPAWRSVHASIWNEINRWLEGLARAFAETALPMGDWQAVLEAGLATLTVGVVPPAIDQVLVGNVDRSRNPDLKLALVLGWNESLFPAPPAESGLLTEHERRVLETQGTGIFGGYRQHRSREHYLAYIACTRARERLVLGYSLRSTEGQPLNGSPFLAELRPLFPHLALDHLTESAPWWEAAHAWDLAAPALKAALSPPGSDPGSALLLEIARAHPQIDHWLKPWLDFQQAISRPALTGDIVEALHGRRLELSVGALEDFAACPFKFFVAHRLLGQERERLAYDARRLGSFAHAVLHRFHRELQARHQRWRDLAPAAARALVAELGHQLMCEFEGGVWQKDSAGRFLARAGLRRLEQLVESLVRWCAQNAFDPVASEVAFGRPEGLPGLELALESDRRLFIRGQIDRVDLCHRPSGEPDWIAVVDYKSGDTSMDLVLAQHGIRMQLLVYLLALESAPASAWSLQETPLPAGAFYISLRPATAAAADRQEAHQPELWAKAMPYQHSGCFRSDALRWFDQRPEARKGDQFRYQLNQDDSLARRGNDALPPEHYLALLNRVRQQLQHLGQEIFRGNLQPAPYAWKGDRACEFCPFPAICRFDATAQPYRVLRAPDPETSEK